MTIEVPTQVITLMEEVTSKFKELLGKNFVGIYLHGSAAMGCYNPEKSDIDFLVVVNEKLPLGKRQEIGRYMVSVADKAPEKGFEMSVVTNDVVQNFSHPTPFEFHCSNANLEKYKNGEMDLWQEKKDPDLAAHFTVTKQRGLCLYGRAIEDVFPNVDTQFYLDSILQDHQESMAAILSGPTSGFCEVPTYGVLNACRVLAFIKNGEVISKAEGGQWAIENCNEEHHEIVRAALDQYQITETQSSVKVDAKALVEFASSIIPEKPYRDIWVFILQ